jgi:hypothetical protein
MDVGEYGALAVGVALPPDVPPELDPVPLRCSEVMIAAAITAATMPMIHQNHFDLVVSSPAMKALHHVRHWQCSLIHRSRPRPLADRHWRFTAVRRLHDSPVNRCFTRGAGGSISLERTTQPLGGRGRRTQGHALPTAPPQSRWHVDHLRQCSPLLALTISRLAADASEGEGRSGHGC